MAWPCFRQAQATASVFHLSGTQQETSLYSVISQWAYTVALLSDSNKDHNIQNDLNILVSVSWK